MPAANDGVEGWDLEASPFHPGELAVQERLGVRAGIDAQARRVVRRFLTEQHRAFFPLLPYVFVGSVDSRARPWASMLIGHPGFVSAPDATTLRARTRLVSGDPLAGTLTEGAPLAVLGIELPTRRRNRAIGHARNVGPDGFDLAVDHTLGICQQYIQARALTFTREPLAPVERAVVRGRALDEAARAMVERADTVFVASVDPRAADGLQGGADVSHRGGRAGFVRVDDARTLTMPDFVGNFIFNTLGNLELHPFAGLLFVDFDTGDLLHTTGRAEVIWEGPAVQAFVGAQRLVRFHLDEVVRVPDALPARFSPKEDSPLLARTGSWAEAARTLEAERSRSSWRPHRVVALRDESALVRSFELEPADGGGGGKGLARYAPGQHLPIRVATREGEPPLVRTYTLSDAYDGRRYRISVKRAGRGGASDWLHDHVTHGAIIEALAPRGAFVFDLEARRPVVLVSGGIGVTPMIAILNSLLVNDGRTIHHGPIYFVHGTRNSMHQAFAEHLREKAKKHGNLKVHVRYSQPAAGDVIGSTHDSEGRVDLALLKALLPFDDHELWRAGDGSLLDVADYDEPPAHGVARGEALLCCARPHPGPHRVEAAGDREGVSLDL